jgi:hypothetical protein
MAVTFMRATLAGLRDIIMAPVTVARNAGSTGGAAAAGEL